MTSATFAAENSISRSIQKVESVTIKKSHTVGDIEDQFENKMGIGIQIEQPDGSLAPEEVAVCAAAAREARPSSS